MTTYQDYLEREYDKAQQELNEYTAQQQAALNLYLKAMQDTKEREIESAERESAQALQAAEDKRDNAVNKAEVTRRIRERNIKETLSNLGLSKSGAKQASISAAQASARAAAHTADEQYRKTAAELSEKLRAYTEGRQEKYEDTAAQKVSAYQAKVASRATALEHSALSNAKSLYKSQHSAATVKLGVGAKNTLTQDQLNSRAFARDVESQIAINDGDPAALVYTLRNTLSFSSISVKRLCVFLYNLRLPDEQKQTIAESVGDVFASHYQQYLHERIYPKFPIPGIERAK